LFLTGPRQPHTTTNNNNNDNASTEEGLEANLTVTATVSNTGARDGTETVQL